MASIHEVAKLAGVSASTVSRVINRTRYVSPEIRERVLKAIETLNFQPSNAARNLRLQQTQIIGVLMPGLEDFFFSCLASVIEETLRDHNYHPLFCSTENSLIKESSYLNMLISQRVDGVLMVPASVKPEHDEQIHTLLSRNVPLVLMDNGIENMDVSQVVPDNYQGGYLAAEHLLKLGHQYIAVVMPGDNSQHPPPGAYYERLEGMQQAFDITGIPWSVEMLIVNNYACIEMGYEATRTILNTMPHITAIFAMSDQIAIGVLRALWDYGINVPGGMSVIGYGNIPISEHLIPRLTTIAQNLEDMGRIAAEILIRQIQQPDMIVQKIQLETKLVARETTASHD